jgi:hypothetical protein
MLLLLGAAFGVASVAMAQPRGAKPRKPKPAPAASAEPKPEEAKPEEAPKPSAPEAAAVDGGPPAQAYDADGGRLSPLTPTPPEFPGAPPAGAGAPLDYDKLLGDVAALRARVAAVADTLFESRLAVAVKTDGSRSVIGRFVVSLDDGAVYTAPSPFRAEDAVTVYDHAVAPGKHAITVDLERKDDKDDAFRTAQRSRFVVDVPKDNRLEVELRLDDDSSMGHDFPSDKSGKYDLRVRMRAQAKPVKK